MTQRSRATKPHIRVRVRATIAGFAKILIYASSEKLHQVLPGNIERKNAKSWRSFSDSWPSASAVPFLYSSVVA
ncbi:hypothetical protein ACFX15_007074 [Malus domestica]